MKAILDSLTKLLFGVTSGEVAIMCLEAMEHFDGKENQFEKDLSRGLQKTTYSKSKWHQKEKIRLICPNYNISAGCFALQRALDSTRCSFVLVVLKWNKTINVKSDDAIIYQREDNRRCAFQGILKSGLLR